MRVYQLYRQKFFIFSRSEMNSLLNGMKLRLLHLQTTIWQGVDRRSIAVSNKHKNLTINFRIIDGGI